MSMFAIQENVLLSSTSRLLLLYLLGQGGGKFLANIRTLETSYQFESAALYTDYSNDQSLAD